MLFKSLVSLKSTSSVSKNTISTSSDSISFDNNNIQSSRMVTSGYFTRPSFVGY
ncbi:expressed protein [Dictyostelium purpureum]|uniref:Expressed protein n=1 Tax=Dictyostelium purpureum TaxID=5786 RepID=F1A2D1_DICPU|nr:uncharacterized protein DICPUDRAFT_93113 [Dictyostelium purpureum]EGC29657.1 expressed protein [Dictyostelium purpureum]|eukprot:XP_003293826.1 expressed protein [Dictyostelium purpureum]